jgi:hypothetical protein
VVRVDLNPLRRWLASRRLNDMKCGLAIVLAVPLVFGACGSDTSSTSDGESNTVGRSDLGKAWPLTVESGELNCEGSDGVGQATITVDGTTYALNGLAKSNDSNEDVQAIWAEDKKLGMGLKKDIGPLIDRALELCE